MRGVQAWALGGRARSACKKNALKRVVLDSGTNARKETGGFISGGGGNGSLAADFSVV